MSLNFGRTLLSIPGPSVIPDRVLNAMHRASPNIYEGELHDVTYSLYPDLKRVARTEGEVAIYIANGHGAWEAALKNVLKPGEKALFLNTGRFADIWSHMADSHQVNVQRIDFGMHEAVDPARVEEALRADIAGDIKAVLMVQSDTASSVRNDVAAVREAIDLAGHSALFMVDCIASLACDYFEMDEWGVDVMVAGCQKGLMTPAGISFVYFNKKADAVQTSVAPGTYWNWTPRVKPDVYYQLFSGTAPTHHVYGLREALDILLEEEGLEACWKRHQTIARAVWAAIDAWGTKGAIKHNIADSSKRSNAVSTLETGAGYATQIRNWTEHNAGVTLGIGLGFGTPGTAEWDSHFRIGHMGHLNIPMIMGALSSIETAMKALNIPHGENGLSNASKVLADHSLQK